MDITEETKDVEPVRHEEEEEDAEPGHAELGYGEPGHAELGHAEPGAEQGEPGSVDPHQMGTQEWMSRVEENMDRVAQAEARANGDSTARRIERMRSSYIIPEGVSPPPLVGNQHFVLYNVAHEGQIPFCAKPAIRLMGIFESDEEARSMLPAGTDVSYFVSPTHKFVPLMSNNETNAEAAIAAIIELHEGLIQANDRDFNAMVNEQRPGVAGKSAATIRKESQRTRAPRPAPRPEDKPSKPCPPANGSQCLAGQAVAVITILHDIRPASLSGEQALEPLIAVLHATDTVEHATQYAKYTATKQYPHNDFFVVDMYKWLFPEDVDFNNLATEEFSNDKIDAIFKKRRADAGKIAELAVSHPDCFIDIDGKSRDIPSGSSCVFTHEPLPAEQSGDEAKNEITDEIKGSEAGAADDDTVKLIEDIAVDLQRLNEGV